MSNPAGPVSPVVVNTAPTAEKRDHGTTHHGIARNDPYAWLRAGNWQEVMRDPGVLAADIRAHLEAENDYTAHVLADTDALQERLFEEMKGRIKEDDSSVPAPDGPFSYYFDFIVGGQHPRYCRCERLGGNETVLVDGNALSQGKDYFSLGGVSHSPDHNLLAYGTDERGSEYYTVRIKNLADGSHLDDVIEDTGGSVTWSADTSQVFYVRLDENHRPSKVFRHALGADPANDVCIYEEGDPGFFVSVGKTQSGDFIVISAHDHETSEVYLIDAHRPDAPLQLVAARTPGHEYSVEHQGERLIVLTNRDDAEDFKIMEAPVTAPGPGNWTELVPHMPGRLILSVVAFRDFVVRLERMDGLPRIVIAETVSGTEHELSLDEEAYALGLSPGFEHDTTSLRFTYSSMTTPSQVFDYDMAERTRVLRKTQEVPSGHEPKDYVTRRIFAAADDGEQVPITLLYRATTPLDGTAPVLLYGYGAYGISMPASFSTNRLSLVDRGFVYAIAHIRGGKDKGYRWYRLGKRQHKTNTFKDFIAAAQHLIEAEIARPDGIVAHGGSAGGMLMGAVANMAPDLFRAIIAEVPFVDVLNTMLDASLPLTPPEWPEWGNPIDSKADYEAIAAYSPYDNVAAMDYPDILAVAGLTDPRVTYWEPAKWVARLRELKTNDTMLLLKTNMDAGHGGASGRFDRLKEVALAYGFAIKVAGSR